MLPINSLDDFFIFERLRSLEYLDSGMMREKWAIENANGWIDNDWIICRNFLVRQKQEVSDQ